MYDGINIGTGYYNKITEILKGKKMAEEKKLVEAITWKKISFLWYTDVVKKAELIEYAEVRGCTIFRPAGYAIWENIKMNWTEGLRTGVENVYIPLFIPESLLEGKRPCRGFCARGCIWVTMGGGEQLQERLCVRPTSKLYSVILQEDSKFYMTYQKSI